MIEEMNQPQLIPHDKHSLKTRYLYKLISNIFGFGINIIIAAITPRGLGPKSYGDYTFLMGFFTETKIFFDGGVSIGFYNKLSRRQHENGLISFYFRFLLLVSSLILGFVVLSQLTRIYPKLWPAQSIGYVYMAVIAVALTWFSQGADQIADALGLTIYSERARMLQKLIGLLLLASLFFSHVLNLRNYFLYQYFNYLLLAGLCVWIIRTKGHLLLEGWRLSLAQAKKYLHEFYHYTYPLFIFSVAGLLTGILDRWLLQVFGGSIQQGFYGLSYHIGVMCFVFTGAMTPLIIRDYSIAYAQKDTKRIAGLLRRYVPMLYAVTAYFACFIAVNSDKVVLILGGSEFKTAGLAVMIMAFYPIHQTYGQLSSSLLLSINKTKLYSSIGISLSILGVIISYFLLAPHRLMGLDLGANGFALKTVFINIISANCMLYFNCKFLGVSFWKYLCHQALPVVCFVLLAIFSSFICKVFLKQGSNVIVNILFSGFIYTVMVAVITFLFPIIFGLERKHMRDALEIIKKMIARDGS